MAKYTLIIPSYNGGDYLKQSVQSVLSQTYDDWELAVLEDGSRDGSLEWLQALNEPRLKVYPVTHNLGIMKNWARALEIPKGEFMTILGQDDSLDPDYLQVMDDLIRSEPKASLYFAHFRYIDADGNVIRSSRPLPARETAAEYIAALFTDQRDTYGTGYVLRSADYHEVGGIPQYEKLLFADDALWVSLMHKSWKATASAECFSVRLHAASVGARARVEWIKAMRPYITFLEELSSRDAAVAQAYRTHGPNYFFGSCYSVYIHSIVKATRHNERLDPSLRRAIFTQLARVSPSMARRLRRTKRVRMFELLNSCQLVRRIYQVYSLLRCSPAPE